MEDLAEAVLKKLEVHQEVVVEESLPNLPPPNENEEHHTTERRRLVRDKKIHGRFHLETEEVSLAFVQGSWTTVGTTPATFRHLATFSSLYQGLTALRSERTEEGYLVRAGGEWLCTLRKRDDVKRFVGALL